VVPFFAGRWGQSISLLKYYPADNLTEDLLHIGRQINDNAGSVMHETHFNGSIDDIRIYDRKLNEEEITALYQEGGWTSLNTGLVAYYPFNGNANDESENGNDGTVYGSALTEGRFGISNKAYLFDGIDDYILCDSAQGILNHQELTISVWVNYFGHSGYESDVVLSTLESNESGGYQIHFNQGVGIIKFVYRDGFLPHHYTNTNTLLDLNTWHHFVAKLEYVDSVLTGFVYLNGSLDNTVIQNDTIAYNLTENLRIGVTYNLELERYYKGKLDDIRIYNRALDSTEIESLYHENGYADLIDIDGNEYNTVTIGNQVWMAENLKTTTYNDGTPIPNVTNNTEWSNLTTDAYCWYNNDEATYKNPYGAMYNWYVVESGNLCPKEWHLPSNAEWNILRVYLGEGVAGGKMKEAGTIHWISPNEGATNESGFMALPNGVRHESGNFEYLGYGGNWWSSTEISSTHSYRENVGYNVTILESINFAKVAGFGIRCIKNSDKSITVLNDTVNEGQQVTLPISVSDLSVGDNIIAYQFDIDFDNTVLDYNSFDLTGTLGEGGTVEVNTSVTGKLSISYMNSTALVGAGELIKLQFNSLMADTTTVSISNAYLNSAPIFNLTNGTVIIRDVTSPTAAITYDDTENRCGDDLLITATLNEPMLETNAVKISMTGGATLTDADMTRVNDTVYTYNYTIPNSSGDVTVSLSNGTDLWGNEVVSTPTSGATFSIIPIIYGDIDEDGKILAYDAALTLQYSVGLDPLPTIDPIPWENWRDTTANVDGIGAVTANDAGMILQYSAGIITSFDAGAKKSASAADVTVEVVDGEIVFYSIGDLIGLNVSTVNDNSILGSPDIVAENFLSAKNIEGTTYKIGLCTSTPALEGDDLIKIPFNSNGSVTFDLVVNTVEKSITVDLATGLVDMGIGGINIYPNPASDMLHIIGLQKETVGRIYNTSGQMIFSSEIEAEIGEVNVSGLPSGLYILKMNIGDEILVKRFTKK